MEQKISNARLLPSNYDVSGNQRNQLYKILKGNCLENALRHQYLANQIIFISFPFYAIRFQILQQMQELQQN